MAASQHGTRHDKEYASATCTRNEYRILMSSKPLYMQLLSSIAACK